MEKLVIYLAAHFLGDFVCQPDWMFRAKGKSWFVNFCHASVYTAVFILLAKTSVLFSLILFVTHFWIDAFKARWKLVNLNVDQLLHFAVIATVIWFGR